MVLGSRWLAGAALATFVVGCGGSVSTYEPRSTYDSARSRDDRKEEPALKDLRSSDPEKVGRAIEKLSKMRAETYRPGATLLGRAMDDDRSLFDYFMSLAPGLPDSSFSILEQTSRTSGLKPPPAFWEAILDRPTLDSMLRGKAAMVYVDGATPQAKYLELIAGDKGLPKQVRRSAAVKRMKIEGGAVPESVAAMRGQGILPLSAEIDSLVGSNPQADAAGPVADAILAEPDCRDVRRAVNVLTDKYKGVEARMRSDLRQLVSTMKTMDTFDKIVVKQAEPSLLVFNRYMGEAVRSIAAAMDAYRSGSYGGAGAAASGGQASLAQAKIARVKLEGDLAPVHRELFALGAKMQASEAQIKDGAVKAKLKACRNVATYPSAVVMLWFTDR